MHRRHHRPWRRRRKSNPDTDPATILGELGRRQLRDIEDCRLAWERSGDPLALCVAVTKLELPDWLVDALLVVLTPDAGAGPRILRDQWRARRQDQIDAIRAAETAAARSHPQLPQTWETARRLASFLIDRVGYIDVPPVGLEAMKDSYTRVARGLANPGRYYRAPVGFRDRLELARPRVLRLVEAAVAPQPRK